LRVKKRLHAFSQGKRGRAIFDVSYINADFALYIDRPTANGIFNKLIAMPRVPLLFIYWDMERREKREAKTDITVCIYDAIDIREQYVSPI